MNNALTLTKRQQKRQINMRTVVTFGTFDLFHVGHIRLLNRARKLGDRLVVGISSDDLNFSKKNKFPEFPQDQRMEIISMIKGVDEVFLEESLELKANYLVKYNADILVMGDDWQGKFDQFSNLCQIIYLPRTPSISTTAIVEKVRS
jgi:glycerol-3-phosphate cytidylyltransferase